MEAMHQIVNQSVLLNLIKGSNNEDGTCDDNAMKHYDSVRAFTVWSIFCCPLICKDWFPYEGLEERLEGLPCRPEI